jgi:hypothetical protein
VFKAGCWWLTPVILATQEADSKGITVYGQPWQNKKKVFKIPISTSSWVWWHMSVMLAMAGNIKEEVDLGKKQDPVSKITKAKRSGDVAQVVKPLSSKCKTLSSNPSTTKK